MYYLFETCVRVGHTLSRQPYGRKLMCSQRDLQYGHFGSHRMLKIESNDDVKIYVTI
jgi:hypothetical protein